MRALQIVKARVALESTKFVVTIKYWWPANKTLDVEIPKDLHDEKKNLGAAVLVALENKENLQYAVLQYAKLQDAFLQRAKLRGADLQYADLQNADLQNADLEDADLLGAKLQGAKLQGAVISEANKTYAKDRGAIL